MDLNQDFFDQVITIMILSLLRMLYKYVPDTFNFNISIQFYIFQSYFKWDTVNFKIKRMRRVDVQVPADILISFYENDLSQQNLRDKKLKGSMDEDFLELEKTYLV